MEGMIDPPHLHGAYQRARTRALALQWRANAGTTPGREARLLAAAAHKLRSILTKIGMLAFL